MNRRIIIGDPLLFEAATADGNSTAVEWPGGKGTFAAWGTFGAGTAKLQWSPDGGTTWLDVSSASLTANGYINFEIAPGKLRANLAGATTPSLNAAVGLYSDSD